MRSPIVIACLALMLASCSRASEETAPETDPVTETAGTPETLDAMPEAFVGRWDFSEQDCAGSGSEMQLAVEARAVSYYESAAELETITRTGPRTIVAEHRFSGEGEQWEEELAYELNEASDRLTVTDPDGSFSTRIRCP